MDFVTLGSLIECIVCIIGVSVPITFLIVEHYGKERRKLHRQIWAFYCEECEAAEMIHKLENGKRSVKTIKTELRDRASRSDLNVDSIRPSTPDFRGDLAIYKANNE